MSTPLSTFWRQSSRFSSLLAGLVILVSLSNALPGENACQSIPSISQESPLFLSLTAGFIVMEVPCTREAGERDTLHLLLKLTEGKEIPPWIDLGDTVVLEPDSPQGRVFLSLTDLLEKTQIYPYAEQLEKWLEEGKIHTVKGLQNLGFRGLYDQASGIIYISEEALADPAATGIGPPGPAHNASGLVALAGCLCHEAGHKWGDLGEREAYALEETVYRRIRSQSTDPALQEGVRRCLYLFYNARHRELGLPVPPEFSEARFRFIRQEN